MGAYLVHQLLSTSAARVPERPAVIAPGETLSYSDLDQKSSSLARTLVDAGVRSGDPVGIAMHKCVDAIIGVYGILKAGAAYVPIDVFAPPGRSARIIANTQMTHILTTPERVSSFLRELCAEPAAATLAHVFAPGDVTGESPESLQCHSWYLAGDDVPLPALTDTHLAYVLHTSGSTGSPKGVAISHRNALCFVEMAAEFWQVSEADRLCSQAPLHFDLSVFDLYVAACKGASIVLIPEFYAAFPKKMTSAIDEHSITIWNSVVSTLTLMMERGKPEQSSFKSLRAVIFSGEVMSPRYLRILQRHIPAARLYNVYGQTEANSSMYYEIETDKMPEDPAWKIPLGRAFPNFEVYAIDENGNRINAPDIRGELIVRAGSVATGYWNNPEMSEAKFVTDPTARLSGARVYRTGDLVAMDQDGSFVFCGRSDDMIKSRGYRVEIGEIDLALLSCPGVESAACIAVPDDEVGNRLFAFATVRGNATLNVDAIIDHCRAHLPKYMVPERVFVKDELPRTSTNKIDRNALRSAIEGELGS